MTLKESYKRKKRSGLRDYFRHNDVFKSRVDLYRILQKWQRAPKDHISRAVLMKKILLQGNLLAIKITNLFKDFKDRDLNLHQGRDI
jgi:hypothetical protein